MSFTSQQITLVLDASSPQAQVGICQQGQWRHLAAPAVSTLEHLHPQIAECLQHCALQLSDITQIVFAAGPGSVLGIRMVNAFLSTLPVIKSPAPHCYAYNSLALQAQLWQSQQSQPRSAFVCTEYKNRQLIGLTLHQGEISEMQTLDAEALSEQTQPIVFYPQRGRTPLPSELPITPIDYRIDGLPSILATLALTAVSTFPFMLTPDDSQYQKWHGQRHRAPLA